MAQNGTLFSIFENPVFSLPARTARVCRQVPLASVLLSLRAGTFLSRRACAKIALAIYDDGAKPCEFPSLAWRLLR